MPSRSQNYPHTIGVSDELYQRWGNSPSRMREFLALHAPPLNGSAPAPESEPAPTRVSGTEIVTRRRTRCPKCTEPVEKDSDAVMMDGRAFGRSDREAFHVDCAIEIGWRRPGDRP